MHMSKFKPGTAGKSQPSNISLSEGIKRLRICDAGALLRPMSYGGSWQEQA